MRRLLLSTLLVLAAAVASAQTATPTPTDTPTPTSTPTQTPTAGPVTAERSSGSIAIPSGGDTSSSLHLEAAGCWKVAILSPATLDGTLKLEVADSGGVFRTLQLVVADGTLADAAGPLAAKAASYVICGAAQVRIKQSTTAAALRTFSVISVKQ